MSYDVAQIRQSVLISETARRFGLNLSKRGREFWCACPFHKEDTASFSIFPAKAGGERFKCFGCHEVGDVIHFTGLIKGTDFRASCEMLVGQSDVLPANKPAFDAEREDVYSKLRPRAVGGHPFQVGKPTRVFNPKHGRSTVIVPTMVHEYLSKDGDLLGLVLRQVIEGRKQTPTVRPAVYEGKDIWSRWSFDEPRPLYGLDQL